MRQCRTPAWRSSIWLRVHKIIPLSCITVSDLLTFSHLRVSCNCLTKLYGLVQEIPQKEVTRFYPRSPYRGGEDVFM